jgi:hypothetical protein
MQIFKYTVANKEGKKLSGTVEAPDEQTARKELNNLGFSILQIQKTDALPKSDSTQPTYVFEAIDKNSKIVTGTIPTQTEEEAFRKLSTEYELTVTAIWKEGSSEEQIKEAKRIGTQKLQQILSQELESNKSKNIEQEKKEQFTKTKIEYILKQVNELLAKFENELDAPIKTEINKKIDKLLRIKQSKNVDYIQSTAEELLVFLQNQDQALQEKGHQDKRIELQMSTKKLLSELNKTVKPKSLSEDIVNKIEKWEASHHTLNTSNPGFFRNIMEKIKNAFKTPMEILVIKDQIKAYNKQLFELIKLYIKEPTHEYKLKVKNSIKTVWIARKKAKHSLKQAKLLLKERKRKEKSSTKIFQPFLEELNSITGWLLALYLIGYFAGLYVTTKDFNLTYIPKGLYIYESKIFFYILGIIFLLHSSLAIKLNFFRKNPMAGVIIFPIFIFSSIVLLLNF